MPERGHFRSPFIIVMQLALCLALLACTLATALASQPAIAIFIAHTAVPALLDSELRSLRLFFFSAARSLCPATVFLVSTMPQLTHVLKECNGMGLTCREIPHLPAAPAGGSSVLSVFVGDGSFDRERQVFAKAAFMSTERVSRLRWIFSLDAESIRNWSVPRFTINVITQRRVASLGRLTKSLLSSDYYGQEVDLSFAVDYDEGELNRDVLQHVRDIDWPHGRKVVRHRTSTAGLVKHVMESWYPGDERDYVVMLEDDVSVSAQWFHYAKFMLLASVYSSSPTAPGQLVGISLYTPRILELQYPRRHINFDKYLDSTTPFLYQLPCSWGEIIFPGMWMELQRYVELREANPTNEAYFVPGSASNTWTGSWKRYWIELMYGHGFVMLYPNFFNQTSFSTNHLEKGKHIQSDESKLSHDPADFTVATFDDDADFLAQMAGFSSTSLLDCNILNIFAQFTSLETIEHKAKLWRGDF